MWNCFFQNLYGHAQMMKLPISDFEWMTPDEIENFDISKAYLDGDIGYIVECDLHYPKKLHNKHSNLPLAPEVIEIGFENLSPYAKNALLESDNKKKYKDVKLTSTFHDRIDYVVHGKNLKLYLDLGLQLVKIKRILKFKQDTFIAKYIQKCTNARQKSQTKFETSQFKKLVSKKIIGIIFSFVYLKLAFFNFYLIPYRRIVSTAKQCRMCVTI